jgi:eukaryotic-like serine/threonine-protein kinase
MTWASKSIGTAVSRTGVFLRKQIWIWPIVATLLLGTIGFFVNHAISSTMRANMQSQLESLLSVESEMLLNWIRTNIANATATANNQAIRDSIQKLIDQQELAVGTAPATEMIELRRVLQKQLGPTLSSHDYAGYIVAGKAGKVVAAATEELIGREVIPEFEELFQKAIKGEASITPPFGSMVMLKDETGRLRSGVPTMLVCAPVRDTDFEVIGVLALRIRPELEFTRILQLGQFGASGETYAFNKSGLMVSNSRFDDELILSGILPDREGANSILNVQLQRSRRKHAGWISTDRSSITAAPDERRGLGDRRCGWCRH